MRQGANGGDPTTASSYDADGNRVTVTDPNGRTTTSVYDRRGLLTAVDDPLNGTGHPTTYGYDAAGNRTSVTDANGNVTTYGYDNEDRLLTVKEPLDSDAHKYQTYTYDPAGNVLTRTDALGQQASYSYDLKGELVTITFRGGTGTVSYSYDVNGNRTGMADASGLTAYSYDALNRLTSVNAQGNGGVGGSTVAYGYDSAGHRTSTTYPGSGGRQVSDSYDSAERLSGVTDWLGNTTQYSYDAGSRLVGVTLPAGSGGNHVSTSDSYDPQNRLTSVVHSLNGTTLASASYSYDAASNRLAKTTVLNGGAAVSESYCYDALNRLTVVAATATPSCNGGSPTVTASTSGCGSTSPGGVVAHAAGDSVSVTATPCDGGHSFSGWSISGASCAGGTTTSPCSFTMPAGSVTVTAGFATSGGGSGPLGVLTTPPPGSTLSGASVTFGWSAGSSATSTGYWLWVGDTGWGSHNDYNQAVGTSLSASVTGLPTDGRTLYVRLWTNTASGWQFNDYSYTSGSSGGGGTTSTVTVSTSGCGYTSLGGVVGHHAGDSISVTATACDGGHSFTGWTVSGASCSGGTSASPCTFTMPAGNVTVTAAFTGSGGGPTASYTYDRVGNRTALVNSAGTTSYSYDAADKLTAVTPPGGGAVGNTYDANGSQLTRGSDSFSWDANNRLLSATVSGTTTTMTYNGDGLRMSRTTGSTTTSFVWDVSRQVVLDDGTQYVYGASGLSEQVANGTPYYFLADGLGSTLAIINGSGGVETTNTYDSFGKATVSGSGHSSEYQFAGQQTDSTGLQYLRARYYDPATGRLLSRDPAAPHRYSYAGNNPASNVDPGGMDWFNVYAPDGGYAIGAWDSDTGVTVYYGNSPDAACSLCVGNATAQDIVGQLFASAGSSGMPGGDTVTAMGCNPLGCIWNSIQQTGGQLGSCVTNLNCVAKTTAQLLGGALGGVAVLACTEAQAACRAALADLSNYVYTIATEPFFPDLPVNASQVFQEISQLVEEYGPAVLPTIYNYLYNAVQACFDTGLCIPP